MKVLDFINDFTEKKIQNTKIAPNAVSEYIKSTLEVKDYVSFIEKRELCRRVLDASCTLNGNIVQVDSVSRYLLFTTAILTAYTNLEFENDGDLDSIDLYDELCKNNLLDVILGVIGAEYDICNNMLNMMLSDVIENNNNAIIILDKSAQKVLDYVDNIVGVLSDKVESLNLDLSQIDIDKYSELIKMLK